MPALVAYHDYPRRQRHIPVVAGKGFLERSSTCCSDHNCWMHQTNESAKEHQIASYNDYNDSNIDLDHRHCHSNIHQPQKASYEQFLTGIVTIPQRKRNQCFYKHPIDNHPPYTSANTIFPIDRVLRQPLDWKNLNHHP